MMNKVHIKCSDSNSSSSSSSSSGESIIQQQNDNNFYSKTIILPVVLSGCETLSQTLREEHRLKVSEKRVLRQISRPKDEDNRLEITAW
jgi:hypothetical protein